MLRLSSLTFVKKKKIDKNLVGNKKKGYHQPLLVVNFDKKKHLQHASGKYFSQIYHREPVVNLALFASYRSFAKFSRCQT